MIKAELCGKCSALMRDGYLVRRVGGGVDNKVYCANCGKRRYGATYELEPRSKKQA
ncbi:MAG: hypothetical protein RR949_07505 [Oscillospiraceae bacterium]